MIYIEGSAVGRIGKGLPNRLYTRIHWRGAIARLLSIILTTRRSSWGMEESKYHFCLQEWQVGGCREIQVSHPYLSSSPRKVVKHTTLETIFKLMKDKKMTGNSKQGFMERKSYLPDLIAFNNEIAWWMRGAANTVYLDCRKAFGTLSPNLLKRQADEVWAR